MWTTLHLRSKISVAPSQLLCLASTSMIFQFPCDSDNKESACEWRGFGFDSWVGKIPWRRARQPTPVFLPGESHGQRSLAGYSPWGHKELNTAEWLTHTHTHTHTHTDNCSTSLQFISVSKHLEGQVCSEPHVRQRDDCLG